MGGGALLVWLALVVSPSFAGRPGFTAPLAWKLFYFHVPVAMVSFAAFGTAFYHSLLYLLRPHEIRDRAAQAAVEVGVLLAALALATGMIWADAEWGVPWRWEERKLVLTFFMFLVYAAYLLLRREIDDPEKRARVSAVYALAGFATVPLTWFAQDIWARVSHPEVFGAGAPQAGVLTEGVMPIFLLGLVVFLGLFAYLFRWRRHLLTLAAAVRDAETAKEVAP